MVVTIILKNSIIVDADIYLIHSERVYILSMTYKYTLKYINIKSTKVHGVFHSLHTHGSGSYVSCIYYCLRGENNVRSGEINTGPKL